MRISSKAIAVLAAQAIMVNLGVNAAVRGDIRASRRGQEDRLLKGSDDEDCAGKGKGSCAPSTMPSTSPTVNCADCIETVCPTGVLIVRKLEDNFSSEYDDDSKHRHLSGKGCGKGSGKTSCSPSSAPSDTPTAAPSSFADSCIEDECCEPPPPPPCLNRYRTTYNIDLDNCKDTEGETIPFDTVVVDWTSFQTLDENINTGFSGSTGFEDITITLTGPEDFMNVDLVKANGILTSSAKDPEDPLALGISRTDAGESEPLFVFFQSVDLCNIENFKELTGDRNIGDADVGTLTAESAFYAISSGGCGQTNFKIRKYVLSEGDPDDDVVFNADCPHDTPTTVQVMESNECACTA